MTEPTIKPGNRRIEEVTPPFLNSRANMEVDITLVVDNYDGLTPEGRREIVERFTNQIQELWQILPTDEEWEAMKGAIGPKVEA